MLEITAVALQLVGFAVYLYYMGRGFTEPNDFALFSIACITAIAGFHVFAALMASLALYAFATNAASFKRVTGQLTTALVCAAFGLMAFTMPKPIWQELRPFALGIGSGLAFYPVLRAVCNDPSSEHSLPWFAWSVSFGLYFVSYFRGSLDPFAADFTVLVSILCLIIALIARLWKKTRVTLL